MDAGVQLGDGAEPAGRVAALSVSSANNWSKVFTGVKVTVPTGCPVHTSRVAKRPRP